MTAVNAAQGTERCMVVRPRHVVVATLLVIFSTTMLAAQAGNPTEDELLALIHQIATVRNELADMEDRVLTEGSDDLLQDELQNCEYEQKIHALEEKIL